ncbi:MAG: hypothetical protein J6B50_00545 [Lachnospiraceae bacterium]|nr:hypothetical protein [Lachnospiraceae bacterium]MBP3505854.1 hypothetical protein [Lachnospiraceae bacterium]
MGESQNDGGFNLAKGSTSILKGVDPNDIGSTGVLYSNRTGETGVLKGSVEPNVYNTAYNYEKSNPSKSESKVGKILIIAVVAVLVIIAVMAALRYFGVI